MASILALGTTANRTSTVVTVAAGSVAVVGVYVASGLLPNDMMAYVTQATPGAPVRHALLNSSVPSIALHTPGDYYVVIDTVGPSGVAVGAFSTP